ncbi:MAG: ABC transporter permease subunit, partial [Anaerolineales bacterium]
RGQYEAAHALGLGGFQTMAFIILPQALRAVIPVMVGQFIGLFKDTTLVAIVGLLDLLGIARGVIANPDYIGTQREVFLFISLLFFVFSYALSYTSRRIEATLGVGQR